LERNSFEQWDFPNGWAPQQHLFVISLLRCTQNEEAQKIGRQIADAFIKTAYNGLFNATKGKVRAIFANIQNYLNIFYIN